MPPSNNGVYIVVGEMNTVVTSMRKGTRWSAHSHQDDEQDALMRNFANLKEILNHVTDLNDLEPSVFLSPFLDTVRSQHTSGPVTALALSATNKFLSYSLIDMKCETAPAAVENIADAVTHARFVGTDPQSDEVVLMNILQVLRTLLLTPAGVLLTNESVCEIMHSCFRICYEMRLSELLRKSAEHALTDMFQLLFCRLPSFPEDIKCITLKKMKIKSGALDVNRSNKKRRSPVTKQKKPKPPEDIASIPTPPSSAAATPDSSTPAVPSLTADENADGGDSNKFAESTEEQGSNLDENENPNSAEFVTSSGEYVTSYDTTEFVPSVYSAEKNGELLQTESSDVMRKSWDGRTEINCALADDVESNISASEILDASNFKEGDYINPRGVRFTAEQALKEGSGPLIPYGLPCVWEILRFVLTHINPLDRNNTEVMMQVGLNLLTVALESGADYIGNYSSLLSLVRDDMCRNLFALLVTEKIAVFSSTIRVCFLMFESLRTHLKFHLEMYLTRLMEIIVSESPRISYEQRELALDSIVQLWRIPGLVTELYLNYDCDLYCSNLFEDLTKLLSKNAFPVSGLYSIHLLSLDALLAVIDSIESHCHYRILSESQLRKDLEDGERSVATDKGCVEWSRSKVQVAMAPSGYLMNEYLKKSGEQEKNAKNNEVLAPLIRPNRMKTSESIPSHEELMALKHKKKLLCSGTEHFNVKPTKGISFLQEHALLKDPLEPQEVAAFLRDNPKLDKRMIGEYISNRKNLKVLEAFVKSFIFEKTRIDEALRMYLETFRLPGEAPLISLLLEHFADHWHKSAKEPFANNDAAFTLAYAVIMLNVDQHNHNVKKQNNPMTLEDFKKNLKGVNGGQDFSDEMLEQIYNAIKTEEIVMPAEQTGLVRENYLWKVLLRRGMDKDGLFVHTPNGLFDHDLFSLSWGPTVAALSYVFDKSMDNTIVQKAVSGFRKCAMISAHYGMSDVFDNLVISLCKYTSLLSSTETPDALPVLFGLNSKAQLAARTMFNLAHRHGDILREGWKNLLDCILQLYRAKLLPSSMVEAEDFVIPSGVVSLIREVIPIIPRNESGLLSSFYSYITLTADSQGQKTPTAEEEAASRAARDCIHECHPEQLVTESKFLRLDSLQELLKALIYECHGPDGHSSVGGSYDEDATVFLLELLIKIVLQNRDRISSIWPAVRDHIYSLIMSAGACDYHFLLERATVGILRITIRMMRKEEMGSQVLHSLRMLLLLRPTTLYQVSRQISYALHELLRTSASSIRTSEEWSTVFTLIECTSSGARPPRVFTGNSDGGDAASDPGAQSDSELSVGRQAQDSGNSSDRGYTSDSELYETQVTASPRHHVTHHRGSVDSMSSSGWILVGKEGDLETVQVRPLPINQFNIILDRELQPHDPFSFMKGCESLSFLVRDVAHVTPENFESCVQCIRTFVEASLNGGFTSYKKTTKQKDAKEKKNSRMTAKKKLDESRTRKSRTTPNHLNQGYEADDEERTDEPPVGYNQVSIQLLDLMHTLHIRAASIFQPSDSQEGEKQRSLWCSCWCPLLQGIARLCCDMRRSVRTSALTYLQRALLVHDLQVLTATEWEACFNQVLFPLLSKLLEAINPQDPGGMEETRVRGATLLCKVFLQHLNPLLTLPTFTALWLTILDFMDKYMKAEGSDLLNEAIPESLKNMLLVMDTAGIFHRPEDASVVEDAQLWSITWDRIGTFLPGLQDEVFKPLPPQQSHPVEGTGEQQQQAANSTAITVENEISATAPPSPPAQVDQSQPPQTFVLSAPMTGVPPPVLSTSTSSEINHPPTSIILHPPISPQKSFSSIAVPYPVPTTTTTTTVPLLLDPSIVAATPVPIFSQVPFSKGSR